MMELEGVALLHIFTEHNKITGQLAREERKASNFSITVLMQVSPVFAQPLLAKYILGTFAI